MVHTAVCPVTNPLTSIDMTNPIDINWDLNSCRPSLFNRANHSQEMGYFISALSSWVPDRGSNYLDVLHAAASEHWALANTNFRSSSVTVVTFNSAVRLLLCSCIWLRSACHIHFSHLWTSAAQPLQNSITFEMNNKNKNHYIQDVWALHTKKQQQKFYLPTLHLPIHQFSLMDFIGTYPSPAFVNLVLVDSTRSRKPVFQIITFM